MGGMSNSPAMNPGGGVWLALLACFLVFFFFVFFLFFFLFFSNLLFARLPHHMACRILAP